MSEALNPGLTRLLPRLRCPDCFSEEIALDEEGLICGQCGRVMKTSDGLLHALPSALEQGETANLEYYDTMSGEEASVLARRATTRNHRIKERMIHSTLELKADVPSVEVLELGTGFGIHGAHIEKLGHAYVGLDISAGLLRSARQRFAELEEAALVAGDATRTPFQEGTFGGVFCVATLHHLPDPQAGVREMMRVLASGGRFCFLEPRRYYPTQLLQYLRHPDTEISAMKMVAGRVRGWVGETGAREVRVSACVFTPNRPVVLKPVYEVMDALFTKVTLLHPLSVMFCVHGEK